MVWWGAVFGSWVPFKGWLLKAPKDSFRISAMGSTMVPDVIPGDTPPRWTREALHFDDVRVALIL